MNAKQVHTIALDAYDSIVESKYWNIFEQIDAAAREGKFSIIFDEVDAQDDLISYLCRNEFHIEYYNKLQKTWYSCNTNTLVPWLMCDKLLIRW